MVFKALHFVRVQSFCFLKILEELLMYKKSRYRIKFCGTRAGGAGFLERKQYFEKSVSENASGPNFTFYDGPPTANGKSLI